MPASGFPCEIFRFEHLLQRKTMVSNHPTVLNHNAFKVFLILQKINNSHERNIPSQ